MAKRKKGHMTCRVVFEGDDRHLHNTTVRIPFKTRWKLGETVEKLAGRKTGHQRVKVFSMECAQTGRSFLPHMRRKGR